MSKFNITKQGAEGDFKPRIGVFQTRNGSFQTPQFMPVATRGSIKGLDTQRLAQLGAQIMLVNTYHLWLRPSPEVVQAVGGIHKFCAWDKPILSDSGGFQVFSLKKIRKVSQVGVEFKSHLDGASLMLTPEKAVEIQEMLGVDIAMALDECPEPALAKNEVEKSLELTLSWAKRCLEARKMAERTALFGITQGGFFRDLRNRAAEEIGALNFDGVAIGGLSVGEPKETMYEVLSYHVDQLPTSKIRYLMGVGTPQDIVEAVARGVDLFDCVMPTRAGRFGRAFISGPQPFINIKNSCYKLDSGPLDENCKCLVCGLYGKAYINHLFKVGEMLGPQLLSYHNLFHYMQLMETIRQAIQEGRFRELYETEFSRWRNSEEGGT